MPTTLLVGEGENMINKKHLENFLFGHRDEIIGSDKKGNKTTVAQEYVAMYTLAAKYVEKKNFYKNATEKQTFRAVELSADDFLKMEKAADEALRLTVRKGLWLNSKCQSLTGTPFITRKVNLNSKTDCAKFVRFLYESVNEALAEWEMETISISR